MEVLVVDDEPLAQQRLQKLLAEYPLVTKMSSANNGLKAVEYCQNNSPDIVLMDIRMPGMDGLEAAMHISAMDTPPAIIFTTAYDEYALEAFDVQAIAYLLKPVRAQKLYDSLERASQLNQVQRESINSESGGRKNIAAKISGNIKLVPVGEIMYFQADQKYVTVKYLTGETIIEDTLKELQTEFEALFIRIHRNALVSKKYITGIKKDTAGRTFVTVEGDNKLLEISRRHLSAVKKLVINM